MLPNDLIQELSRIASKVNSASSPRKSDIIRDLKRVIIALDGNPEAPVDVMKITWESDISNSNINLALRRLQRNRLMQRAQIADKHTITIPCHKPDCKRLEIAFQDMVKNHPGDLAFLAEPDVSITFESGGAL